MTQPNGVDVHITNKLSKKSDLSSEKNNQQDYPAQSYNLPKQEQVNWLNNNALFERKGSIRRKSNSNTISHSSSSTSQRFYFNFKSKTSIIGLPQTQNSNFIDCSKVRRNSKPSKARFFPKISRSRSSGKSSSSVPPPSEPSSPKVSCIGRVRSKKETIIARSRSLRFRNRSITDETPPVQSALIKPEKTPFWSKVRIILRIGEKKNKNNNNSSTDDGGGLTESPPRKTKKNVTEAKHKEITSKPVSEPPRLGGLKRFSSGRKSESWGGCELDFGGKDDSDSPPEPSPPVSVFSRRGVGQPQRLDCYRDLELMGPASV